jgi:hypothetical protein
VSHLLWHGFALEVEGEEARQNLVVAEVRRPAVSGEHGPVQIGVGVREPGWPQVVKVRQGSALEFLLSEAGRVEPAVAQADELAGGRGDRIALLIGGAREREGLEAVPPSGKRITTTMTITPTIPIPPLR